MKEHKIAVVAGDGIGPEVIEEGLEILSSVSRHLDSNLSFKKFDLGASRYLKRKETLPDSVLADLASSDAIYLGAVGDPKVPPGILEREILLKLRFELDLYANLRPCVLLEGAFTPLKNKTSKDINFVVVRENSEGAYIGSGRTIKKGTADETAIQEDVNTRKGVERILRYAFEFCKNRNEKGRLTLVDKANVFTHAHGLWRRIFEEVGEKYPKIERNALYVDRAAMDFVRRPETFDVVVTNNLFGDILTDLGGAVSGGLGLAASANLNDSSSPHHCRGLFEPVHGSAPDIQGKGKANPLAAILAGKMMLEFLGENKAAKKIENAVRSAVLSGKIFEKESSETQISTSEVGDLVRSYL